LAVGANAISPHVAQAPALHGGPFMANWLNSKIYTLFIKLRDTMPATYPETVSDATKLDILAYLLQATYFQRVRSNSNWMGKTLQTSGSRDRALAAYPISLVQVTGCLSQGPGASWILTTAGEPALLADENSAEAKTGSLGTLTYRLVSIAAFNPAVRQGEKVEARGLLYREIKENRINLTSLRTVSKEACNPRPN
jgi:hypothetical protein